MRTSKTLAKIRAGKPVKLAYMGHFLPPFIAYAAHYGYDAIWLDLEHRPMDSREVQALLAFSHLYDIDCIIRTPTREKTLLYRYLEDGATGLILPLIENAGEARQIVQSTKFPPLGDRGLEGRGLDGNFGIDSSGPEARLNFIESANRETVLIMQLESPNAVANAASIAAVEGVDVIFGGPTDYGIRNRLLPADQQRTWDEALAHIAEAARQTGKAWGTMPPTVEKVREAAAMGAQFLAWGRDLNILVAGLKQSADELNAIYG